MKFVREIVEVGYRISVGYRNQQGSHFSFDFGTICNGLFEGWHVSSANIYSNAAFASQSFSGVNLLGRCAIGCPSVRIRWTTLCLTVPGDLAGTVTSGEFLK